MNKQHEKHFMGRDGFYWFFGKVVDREGDTLSLGRVRVRVFGIHPDDENLVPNDHLPWATPIMPVTSAGIFGVGASATGLMEGSYVFGFFADGEDAQIPIVLGSISNTLGHNVLNALDNIKDDLVKIGYPERGDDIIVSYLLRNKCNINKLSTVSGKILNLPEGSVGLNKDSTHFVKRWNVLQNFKNIGWTDSKNVLT